jgi:tRNA threonylcarbamoyladenosine biosynthesis protein TsaB
MSSAEHGRQALEHAQARTLLAVETSTIACSVALSRTGVVYEDHRIAPRQHNQLVLPMIDALLTRAAIRPAQLDGVVFGCGPGSFTGVRIAASVAQGIALGCGIETVGVSTLRVLAQTARALHREATTLIAAIQSRPGEVYLGRFAVIDGLCHLRGEERVVATSALELPQVVDGWCIVGDAAGQFADVVARRHLNCVMDATVLPRAAALLELGQVEFERGAGVAAAYALPVYLEGTRPWRKLAD